MTHDAGHPRDDYAIYTITVLIVILGEKYTFRVWNTLNDWS